LADDWRGWDGSRTWQSVGHELTLEAEHDRIKRVALTVTILPKWSTLSPVWSATCVLDIDPGEQMTNLALGLTTHLGPLTSRYRD
jgi:hypothetical protein